jgi:hypothetical protein
MMKAVRMAWNDFPPCIILANEKDVLRDSFYHAAKHENNNLDAFYLTAKWLGKWVANCITGKPNNLFDQWRELDPLLVAAIAVEGQSVNAIPETLVGVLAAEMELSYSHVDLSITQINRVGHTKSNRWHRLANQPLFDGEIQPGRNYLLVDDFIGMGGTIANFKGYIESKGGKAIGALVLTGQERSAILTPPQELIQSIELKYGKDFTDWWHRTFGFCHTLLTASEAGYLWRSAENADQARARILESIQT